MTEALGPDFTLLCDDPAVVDAFLAAAEGLDIPLEAPRCNPAWFEHWQRSVILVRPDGFVAWAGTGADADGTRDILSASIGAAR